MNKLECKYGIGDKLWIVDWRPTCKTTACDLCAAEGKIVVQHSGVEIECPRCDGQKEIKTCCLDSSEWVPIYLGEVRAIVITDNSVEYHSLEQITNCSYMCEEAETIFTSQEEAQAECDIRKEQT